MEKIEVVYKETPVQGTYHKYLLYTDNDGNVKYARGGPTPFQFSGWGSINTEHGNYVPDPDNLDYINPSDDTRHREEVAKGDNLSNEWNAILTAMDDLDSQFVYSPVSQNSNTVIDWALLYAGLPLPTDDGTGEYFSPASILSPDYPPVMVPFLPAMIAGLLPDWLLPAGDRMGQAPRLTCPLVLDLDGDGIETTMMGHGAGGSKTYFDMDNDGFAERTAWAVGGDGVLALDKNSNGKIDNQGELFGNSATYADGFAALAALDSNKDGKITSADTQWSKLSVWVDADGDGITDAGELKTLSSLKITQINLNATAQTNLLNNENAVTASSTFVMNGANRNISDVWFRNDQMDTRYLQDVTLNAKTLFLPTLKGFGNLKDLHIAMSQDSTLLTLVENFAKNWSVSKFKNGTLLDSEIQAVLFKWAGVETVSSTSRGQYIDAKVLTFMEKLTGQAYGVSSGLTTAEPDGPFQAAGVNEAYKMAFDAMKAQLIAQAGGQSIFAQAPQYDFVTGELVGGVLTAQSLAMLKTQASSAADKDAFWKEVGEFLLNVKESSEFTDAEKSALDAAIRSSSTLSWDYISSSVLSQYPTMSLTGTELTDYLVGTQGANSIYAGGGNDTLKGNDGNDQLYGDSGDDILIGGTGDDYLNGGSGNDLYIYEAGDGLDRISDSSGSDTLKIKGNYASADISFARLNEQNLGIYLKGQKIADVSQHFSNPDYMLEKIALDNGTLLDISGLKNVKGDGGSNTLNGLDHIYMKDDYIYGESGNDTLNGKIGNDFLFGGSGNDKYIYSNGADQGTDTLRDDDGTADSLVLGSAYTSANVSLVRVGSYDLAVKSAGKTLVLIDGQFNGYGAIETLVYGNGATLNLLTYSHTVNGTSAGDVIYGTSFGAGADKLNGLGGDDAIYAGSGNDIVSGGDGNDYIHGEDGNDTLDGNAGNDTVNGGFGNDTIIYESGLDRFSDTGGTDVISITNTAITSTNMVLRRNIGNQNDLDVLLNGTHAFTINGQFSQNGGFETIRFSNGTTFNLTNIQYASTGTSGNDTLYGISFGGNPNDIMNGGAGNDYLYGYEGNDTLDGGTGADYLYGGKGNDVYKISLNSGVDVISDEAGSDTIQFGAGFSRTNMTVQRDTVSGNNLNILFGGVLAVTIQNHFQQGYLVETLKFSDNTTYSLTGVSFTQNGTAASDYLQGYDGVDVLKGNGGNDSIYAYAGNDTLEGGAGRDYLYGGFGDDTYVFGAGFGSTDPGYADYVSEEAGQGTDTVRFTTLKSTDVYSWTDYYGLYIQSKANANDIVNVYGYVNNDSLDVVNRVERVTFSDGVTWTLSSGLTVQDSDEAHSMYGSSLNDTFKGNGGNDSIYAYAGNDTLEGGAGRDYLYGGLGDDTYAIGALDGLDYITDDGGVDVIRLAAGLTTENISIADYSSYDTKIIVNADVNEMQISNQRYAGNAYAIEKLQFSDGFVADFLTYKSWVWGSTAAQTTNGTANADTILGRGGNDTINGNAGNDAMHGGAGNDIVKGGDGNDIVHGGIGNDSVYGDAGNDVLYGDDGLDNLWGGAGADTFMFLKETAFKNIDVINDFSRTQLDKINVKDLLQGYDPLTKAITDYVQITTSGSDSILRVDADGGANSFVQIATLKGVTGLTDEAALLTGGTLIA